MYLMSKVEGSKPSTTINFWPLVAKKDIFWITYMLLYFFKFDARKKLLECILGLTFRGFTKMKWVLLHEGYDSNNNPYMHPWPSLTWNWSCGPGTDKSLIHSRSEKIRPIYSKKDRFWTFGTLKPEPMIMETLPRSSIANMLQGNELINTIEWGIFL